MADQTITIKFTPPASPGGNPTWIYDPSSVEITKEGSTIDVTLSLTNATGTLVYNTTAINWNTGTPVGQFSVSPQGGGTTVEITDQDSDSGSYGFTVNVLYNGTAYTSPDPTIINKVPSPP